MVLPVNIDATYADDPNNPARKLHKQHHDTVHGAVNGLAATYVPLTEADLAAGVASRRTLGSGATQAGQGSVVAAHDATLAGLPNAYVAVKSGKPNIVFDGDSMTVGTGGGPAGGGGPSFSNYPRLATDGMAGATVNNFGVGGQTVLSMSGDAATQIDPLIDTARLNIVALLGGTNDIKLGAASSTTAYNRIVAYCTARRAAGWKVVVGTILPRDPTDAGANFETDRQAVNTSIRANWATFADALADVGADATIGAAGAQTNTVYYSDLIHPTTLGYEIVASYYRTAFAALGCLSHTHPVPSLWIPATAFAAAQGGATLAAEAAALVGPVWQFPATGVPYISALVQLPAPFAQWRQLNFLAYWTIEAAGAGTVIWRIDTAPYKLGSNLAIVNNGSQIAFTAPAAGTLAIDNITNPAPKVLDYGAVTMLRVVRIGGTSVAAAALLGILVEQS